MTTLKLFAAQNISVPSNTSWYLADLGEFRGKHALIESAVSYNLTELQAGVREQLHDRIAARLLTLVFDYGDTP